MKYPLVEITWTDAFSAHDKSWWLDEDMDALLASVSKPDRACGYMMRNTKKGVILAGQKSSSGMFGDIFFVPRGMVRKLRILRGKR